MEIMIADLQTQTFRLNPSRIESGDDC